MKKLGLQGAARNISKPHDGQSRPDFSTCAGSSHTIFHGRWFKLDFIRIPNKSGNRKHMVRRQIFKKMFTKLNSDNLRKYSIVQHNFSVLVAHQIYINNVLINSCYKFIKWSTILLTVHLCSYILFSFNRVAKC